MRARELEADARKLAVALMGDAVPCRRLGESISCVSREEQRPLTRAEKARGWARRPFDAYHDENMCVACSAYWHASVAAIRLDDAARADEHEAAAKSRAAS